MSPSASLMLRAMPSSGFCISSIAAAFNSSLSRSFQASIRRWSSVFFLFRRRGICRSGVAEQLPVNLGVDLPAGIAEQLVIQGRGRRRFGRGRPCAEGNGRQDCHQAAKAHKADVRHGLTAG